MVVEQPRGRSAGYRTVWSTPGFGRWAATSVAARLPRAMTPLGLVLFGASAGGSFSAGALLVGCHAAGDVLAAPWIGRRLSVRTGLLLEAVGLAAMTVLGAVTGGPVAVLATLAALAGGASAGVPGEQRARLAELVPAGSRPAAFSLESTASALLYTLGPAVVGLLSALSSTAALLTAAGIAALGALSATGPGSAGTAARTTPGALSVAAVTRLAWPSYLGAVGFMLAVTALDVVLPARLTELGHDPALAGLLLGAFALTGSVGGLVYGSHSWPGTPSRQALVLVVLLCGGLGTLALVGQAWGIAVVLLVTGCLGPPALVARSLVLQARLPPSASATGFSGLSAAAGIGTSAAGLVAAPLLAATSATATLLVALGLATVAAVLSAAYESAPGRRVAVATDDFRARGRS
jgi:hypothetical protein